MGASGAQSTGYEVEQSIRFNDNDSAYMSRTHTASNKRTFTWSAWVKRASLGGYQRLFSVVDSGDDESFIFRDDGPKDQLQFYSGDASMDLKTNRVFRDVSAWYHILLVIDTTQTVSSQRGRIYINGIRETDFATETYPSKDAQTAFNGNVVHEMGRSANSGQYFDGYMAEVHFLDGYAYGPEFFGEFNSSNIWIPKEYTGDYGDNGFKIDGRDSGDLGDDESGEGHDWSTSGLAAHDQVADSPTNNFAVLNVIDTFNRAGGELRNGNLEFKDNSANEYVYCRATFEFDVTDSDGWYWESTDVVDGSGIGGITEVETQLPGSSSLAFTGARGFNSINTSQHYKLENTTYQATTLGVTSNAGDIIQFCVKNGKLFIGINGTYVLSGNPATEANPLFSSLTGKFMPFAGIYSGASYNTIHNFGQDGTFAGTKTAQGNTDANGFGNFFYAPPTGAKALCSRSLGA